MMLLLQIAGIDQKFSFVTGTMANVLRTVMPNGQELTLEVSEEVASSLIQAFVAEGSTPAQRAVDVASRQVMSHPLPREEAEEIERDMAPMALSPSGDLVFGGEVEAAVANSLAAAEATLNPPPPSPSSTSTALLQELKVAPMPNWAKPSMRVSKDEAGNPVFSGVGLVDPLSVIGGEDPDQGDTGQI